MIPKKNALLRPYPYLLFGGDTGGVGPLDSHDISWFFLEDPTQSSVCLTNNVTEAKETQKNRSVDDSSYKSQVSINDKHVCCICILIFLKSVPISFSLYIYIYTPKVWH